MNKTIIAAALAVASLSACAPAVEVVDTSHDRGEAVVGLDYRDFENAASACVQSLLASGAADNPKGGRYVLIVSGVTNDTMQSINASDLVKSMTNELRNSGKVAVTTAIGVNGRGPEDAATAELRQLRGNSMIKQSTVKADGQVIAPDLALKARISQRNIAMPSGKTQVEYTFTMTLTDVNTGLELWGDNRKIIKRSSQSTVTW